MKLDGIEGFYCVSLALNDLLYTEDKRKFYNISLVRRHLIGTPVSNVQLT